MGHGFGSGHGYYFMSYANGGTIILLILLGIAIIALIAFFSDHFRKKSHPEHRRFLEILKDKYVKNEITADEYRERSMVLDDEYWLDSDNPAMMILKERYSRCEIDSREYVERRKELQGKETKTPLEILKERYARGEISSEEFQKIKSDIH